ncbi:MAG: MFS transporter [Bacteroidota bacterium]
MPVAPSDSTSGLGDLGLGPPPRAAATLGALWLLVFTAASQTIIITPVLPVIGEALGVGVDVLGSLVSAYSWALAGAALVMGPISDRIGRRRVLLIGSGALAGALVLHGLANTFEMLLAARILAGICGGMLSGAAVSYVGDAVPYRRRGWATGIVMSGIPVGLVLGVPVGRILAAGIDFRVPFVAFAALMGIAFLLVLAVVPQPDVKLDESRLDAKEFVLGYLRLLGDAGNRAAALTYFLMYLSLGLFIAFLPQWITDTQPLDVILFGKPVTLGGLPVDFIAMLFSVGGLASIVIGPWAGGLSDRAGRKPIILASCIGLLLVTVSVTYLVGPDSRWALYPIYVAVMALFALRASPLQALLTALVPGRQRGTLMSLVIAVGQIGTGAGAVLAGMVYAGAGFRTVTFISAATILVMALVVWWALPEPTADATLAPAPQDDTAEPLNAEASVAAS